MRDVAHPAIEIDRDMVIPSLPEESSPPARPTSARDRLAQARRMRPFNSDALDSGDINDGNFDDGPPHPPGQVGPTFVAGALPIAAAGSAAHLDRGRGFCHHSSGGAWIGADVCRSKAANAGRSMGQCGFDRAGGQSRFQVAGCDASDSSEPRAAACEHAACARAADGDQLCSAGARPPASDASCRSVPGATFIGGASASRSHSTARCTGQLGAAACAPRRQSIMDRTRR